MRSNASSPLGLRGLQPPAGQLACDLPAPTSLWMDFPARLRLPFPKPKELS